MVVRRFLVYANCPLDQWLSIRKYPRRSTWTHDCNLRCPYCYTGAKIGRHMREVVAEEAINFSLAEAKCQDATDLEVVFFGGEPLMRLEQLCSIADRFVERKGELGVSFKLSTNGLLLTPPAREALAKRDVYVSVSLDGAPSTQEQQRPTPNGRPYAKQLARMIPEWLEWNPCMNVTTVVTPDVAERLDRSSTGWSMRGFPTFRWHWIFPLPGPRTP